jgi:type IV secretory pathway VirB2 component (pilin)
VISDEEATMIRAIIAGAVAFILAVVIVMLAGR